jgi:hypothetical protein
MIKKSSVSKSKAEKMPPEALTGKIVVGKLYEDNQRPELSERLYSMMNGA